MDVAKLLCDPDSPHPTKNRVDLDGNYIPWQGITSIMLLNEKSRELAETIHARLENSEIIKKYVALLPVSSYHVTLRGIRERFRCQNGKEYNEYILAKRKQLEELSKNLEESKIDVVGFDFDIKTIENAPYAGLSMHFESAKDKKEEKDEEEKGKDDEECLRKLEDMAVDCLGLPLKRQGWHMSLGYFYKNIGKKDKKLVKEAVKDALNINDGSYTLYFSKPAIYHFKDLSHFEPL